MKGIERTQVIKAMITDEEALKEVKTPALQNTIFEKTGIIAPLSTLGKLRKDLDWPRLIKKPQVDQSAQVEKLQEVVGYLINQLNIDLPERLK